MSCVAGAQVLVDDDAASIVSPAASASAARAHADADDHEVARDVRVVVELHATRRCRSLVTGLRPR